MSGGSPEYQAFMMVVAACGAVLALVFALVIPVQNDFPVAAFVGADAAEKGSLFERGDDGGNGLPRNAKALRHFRRRQRRIRRYQGQIRG